MELPEQPQPHDAVLGQSQSPQEGSAVLGGLAGVKQRLASDITERRMLALSDALHYGEAGFDLVIEALQDPAIARNIRGILQQVTQISQPSPLPNLPSAVEMNYLFLQKLLSAGQWEIADRLTERLMVEVARRVQARYTSGEWERPSDRPKIKLIERMSVNGLPYVALECGAIANLPCADLQTLDRLWLHHSQGKFGFSVQAKIWQQVGAQSGGFSIKTYYAFGDRLGWRKHEKGYLTVWHEKRGITFSLSAPDGHLPWKWEQQGSSGVTSTVGKDGRPENSVFYSQITYMASRLKACGCLSN